MNELIVLLGANLGNEIRLFTSATQEISSTIGNISKQSHIYTSKAWGFEHQNLFYNQVVCIRTNLEAQTCLERCLQIEKQLGRIRIDAPTYQARIIDIDILYYNSDIIELPNLTVPHKFLHERKFTLVPLCEIMPDFTHPILQKTNRQLLEECTDKGEVKKVERV